MRLICPNCDAQYEVDDAVIPESGRDVQCSNCGHTWFQRPAHMDRELAEELDLDTSESELSEDGSELADGHGEAMPEGGTEFETEDDVGPLQTDRPARELDPALAGMLREEAEREVAARRDEGGVFETQTDLGLDDPAALAVRRTEAARARMARLRGEPEAGEDDEFEEIDYAAPPVVEDEPEPESEHEVRESRGDLLPDIEDVRTDHPEGRDEAEYTIDPEYDEEPAEETERRRGFSGGFLAVFVLVALAVAVYALAPLIAANVPQAEPYLVAYVEWANTLRGYIDRAIDATVDQISGLFE